MFSQLFRGAIRRYRRFWWKVQGVRITGQCWLQSIDIPRNHSDIELHDGVALDRGVTLVATGTDAAAPRISIGRGTYINRHTMLDASERIQIGADCMIGPFCYITDHDHGMALGVPVQQQTLIAKSVLIGDDVWIGAHVTVLKGVHIANGAIIAAGAVVTKNVEANTVVAGVPASEISKRHETQPRI